MSIQVVTDPVAAKSIRVDTVSVHQIDAYIVRHDNGERELRIDKVAVLDGNVRTNVRSVRPIPDDHISLYLRNGCIYTVANGDRVQRVVIPVHEVSVNG